MNNLMEYCRKNFSLVVLGVFWLVALLNPVFKKYDYGAEFPLVIVLGVLVLAIAIYEFKKRREFVFFEPLFLVIFFLAMAASFYFSQTKNFGFSEVLAFSSVVPLYLLFAYKKNDWHEKFLKIVAAGLFISITIGFLFYFFGPDNRIFGLFFNILYHANKWPNAFALFILMCWPVLLILYKGKLDLVRILGLSLVFSAFLLTYSRGALIVLGGQFVLLLIYYYKSVNVKNVLKVLFVAIFTLALFFVSNYVRGYNYQVLDVEQKVSFENGESLTSMQERFDFWNGAVQLIEEKPLFGWGPFSFRYAYNDIQKTFLGNSDHPHNIFLKIGSENGLIALGAFLFFLLIVFLTVVKREGK